MNQTTKKIYHAELKPCILLGGFFVFLGILAWNKSVSMGLSFLISGILLGFFLYWRIRFDEKGFTFYFFNVFPVRCDYAGIAGYRFIENQRVELGKFPRLVIVYKTDGSMKKLPLGLFGTETANAIAAELKQRCPITEKTMIRLTDPSTLALQMRRHAFNDGISLCIIALLCIGFGVDNLHRTLQWDARRQNWKKIPASVSIQKKKVIYQYTFNGILYANTRVAYYRTVPETVSKRYNWECIVNPLNPKDSALLHPYSTAWHRFLLEMFCFAAGLVFAWIGFVKFCVARRVSMPANVYEYMCSIPQKQIEKIMQIKLRTEKIGRMDPVEEPFILDKSGRYGYFLPKRSIMKILLWAVPFFLAMGGIFLNISSFGFALVAFFFGWGLFSSLMNAVTIFDFEKKQLFRCRKFNPKNPPNEGNVPFSDLACLQLRYEFKSNSLFLIAVKTDGSFLPVALISAKGLAKTAASIPELAKKMGNLPVLVV